MSKHRITPEMVKAGTLMADELMDASISSRFAGMGGCRPFDINEYTRIHRGIIMEYVNDEIQSVEGIYRAMELARTTK